MISSVGSSNRQLEKENERMRCAVTDLMLDKQSPAEAAR